jgi:predicted CopG family antitoxin
MSTHISMSSINISIKEEAYEYLKTMKKDNESFSDIILSFKKEEKNGKFMVNLANSLKEKIKKENNFSNKDYDESYFKEREESINKSKKDFDRSL